MAGTTFSQFTPISMWPDTNGNANKVLMSTGGGAAWTVVPIVAGGTGQTTAQAALNALTGGNLNLTGTGARITGDFSTTTIANRVLFKTDVANAVTSIGAIPNGTVANGVAATAVTLEDNTSVSGAGSVVRLENVQGTEVRLMSMQRNGGTVLPMSFYVGRLHTQLSYGGSAGTFAVSNVVGGEGSEVVLTTASGGGAQVYLRNVENGGNTYTQLGANRAGSPMYYDFGTHYFRNVAGGNLLTLGSAGQMGVGAAANYGTAGQVLLSGGASAAPYWSTALADGTTATTQPSGTNNTTVATTQFAYNNFVKKSELKDIPNDLMVTAIGSLDFQFTVGNAYAGYVDAAGTPSYISNASNATILGNASGLGQNYTVINTAYTGGSTYKAWGSIAMTIDVAKAAGLSDVQYIPGTSTINPAWKGNYNFSAFSSLFKIREYNFWDYPTYNADAANATFEYSVNMIPVTNDYTSASYGKYNVSSTVYASATYHSANLGARWMGVATKIRNV